MGVTRGKLLGSEYILVHTPTYVEYRDDGTDHIEALYAQGVLPEDSRGSNKDNALRYTATMSMLFDTIDLTSPLVYSALVAKISPPYPMDPSTTLIFNVAAVEAWTAARVKKIAAKSDADYTKYCGMKVKRRDRLPAGTFHQAIRIKDDFTTDEPAHHIHLYRWEHQTFFTVDWDISGALSQANTAEIFHHPPKVNYALTLSALSRDKNQSISWSSSLRMKFKQLEDMDKKAIREYYKGISAPKGHGLGRHNEYSKHQDDLIISMLRHNMSEDARQMLLEACYPHTWSAILVRARTLKHRLLEEGEFDLNNLPHYGIPSLYTKEIKKARNHYRAMLAAKSRKANQAIAEYEEIYNKKS